MIHSKIELIFFENRGRFSSIIYFQKFMLNLIFKLNKSILFCVFFFATFLVASQNLNHNLAVKYVALRGATWGLQQPAKPPVTEDQVREQLNALLEFITNNNSKSKNWSANHPAKKALNNALQPELKKLSEAIIRSRDSVVLMNLKDIFTLGVASLFSESELRELLAYYSSPPGRLLIPTQQTISEKVQNSISARQNNFSPNVEWPRRTNPDPEKKEEILGLFDEAVKIQLSISDPGPNGDRTGLQAIGLMISAGVVDVFPEILAEWERIPQAERAKILNWRNSAQGLKERELIYKAALKIREIYKPEQQMEDMMNASINLEVKAERLISLLAIQFP